MLYALVLQVAVMMRDFYYSFVVLMIMLMVVLWIVVEGAVVVYD
jgi:hypothetical protein